MKPRKNQPIGVFDSGLGGLTVVLELTQKLPREAILYFADTAHVPYGSREPEELKGFARSIGRFLVEQGSKIVVIACNTSTSLSYEELKTILAPIPVIGVIEPGVEKALETTRNSCVGLIGTQATIKSGVYQKLLLQKKPGTKVLAQACPLLVPFVEKGQLEGQDVYDALRQYLAPLQEGGIDTLILGCTHYPFLIPVITKLLGPGVQLIDPARETVTWAGQILKSFRLCAEGAGSHRFFASHDPGRFREMASRFLGWDTGLVEEVPPWN